MADVTALLYAATEEELDEELPGVLHESLGEGDETGLPRPSLSWPQSHSAASAMLPERKQTDRGMEGLLLKENKQTSKKPGVMQRG